MKNTPTGVSYIQTPVLLLKTALKSVNQVGLQIKARWISGLHHQNKADGLISEVGNHLVEACINPQPIVSFVSKGTPKRFAKPFDNTRSFRHVTQVYSKHPGVIERVLRSSRGATQNLHLPFGRGYSVLAIKDLCIDRDSELPTLSCNLVVKVPSGETKNIPVMEFAPPYDGKSLSHKLLLSAKRAVDNSPLVQDSRADNYSKSRFSSTSPGAGIFCSAVGVGRSAALIVIDRYQEILANSDSKLSINDVEHQVDEIIEAAREQTNDRRFVHTGAMRQEVIAACRELAEEKILMGQGVAVCSGEKRTVTMLSQALPLNSTQGESTSFDQLTKSSEPMPNKHSAKTFEVAGESRHPDISALGHAGYKGALLGYGRDKFIPIPLDLRMAVEKVDLSKFAQVRGALDTDQRMGIAKGILTGLLLGDMLGSSTESMTALQRFDHLLPDTDQTDCNLLEAVVDPERQSRPFRSTDDSQQAALALFDQLDHAGQIDGEGLSNRFIYPNFSSGRNNSAVFVITGSAASIRSLNDSAKDCTIHWSARAGHRVSRETGQLTQSQPGSFGAGNGALMRIASTIIPHLIDSRECSELIDDVVISGHVTHPSNFSHAVCVGFTKLIADCIAANQNGEKPKLGSNFFVNTMRDVLSALGEDKMGLDSTRGHGVYLGARVPPHLAKDENLKRNWCAPRSLDHFLEAPSSYRDSNDPVRRAIHAGSVKVALQSQENPQSTPHFSPDWECYQTAKTLARWNSRSSLAATFPSVVYLLERFGYDDPARAVKMTALVTKDSDTCAAIVGAVMGALHGSQWQGGVFNEMQMGDPSKISLSGRLLSEDSQVFTLGMLLSKIRGYFTAKA